MSRQILITLLNCSWQWGLLVGFIWLVNVRLRPSKPNFHTLCLLTLISLPVLFGLNQIVPVFARITSQLELIQMPLVGKQPIVQMLPEPSTYAASGHSDIAKKDIPSVEPSIPVDTEMLIPDTKRDPASWSWIDGLIYLWAIGVLITLTRLLLGWYLIRRLLRLAVEADDSYQAVCKRLGQQMKIDSIVTIYLSDQVLSPISVGWWTPRILIPPTISAEQFELIAAHELAHVKRWDWLTNLLSLLIGAIFFFHPLYYWLNQQLAEIREQICDDWVIELIGARQKYAQCLLDIASGQKKAIALTLGLSQQLKLKSRIRRIMEDGQPSNLQPGPQFQLIVTVLLLIGLPLLATAQLIPVQAVQMTLFNQSPNVSIQPEAHLDLQALETGSQPARQAVLIDDGSNNSSLVSTRSKIKGQPVNKETRQTLAEVNLVNRATLNTEWLHYIDLALQNEANPKIRCGIIKSVLEGIGEAAVPILVNLLADSSAEVRYAAVNSLGEIGKSAIESRTKIIEGLSSAITDQEEDVRRNAAEELADVKASSPTAINALITGLQDQSRDVRLASAEALDEIGEPAKAAVPALMNALGDESNSVRRKMMSALGEMGSSARSAVPKLIELSKDKSDKTRLMAIDVLGSIGEIEGPIKNQITPVLIDALTDESDDVRREAAEELGDISATSSQAISALMRGLHDEEGEVRDEVIESLGQIGQPALSDLKKASIYGSDEMNLMIVQVTTRIGLPAVPLLNEMMKNLSDQIRYEIIDALGDIGEDNPSAVASIEPVLISVLASQSEDIRRNAIEELGDIKASSRDSIRVLSHALLDPNRKMRRAAAEALGEIGPSTQSTSAKLAKLLGGTTTSRDEDKDVRLEAVEALGKIGTPTQVVVPALIKALNDPSSRVRRGAAKALQQNDGKDKGIRVNTK